MPDKEDQFIFNNKTMDIEAKQTGVQIKIKRGNRHVRVKIAFSIDMQILRNSHGIDLHDGSFIEVKAFIHKGKCSVDKADLIFILINVHPGIGRFLNSMFPL